jgi:hypothetical protein
MSAVLARVAIGLQAAARGLAAQAAVLEAQADLLIAVLAQADPPPAAADTPPCRHPEDARLDAASLRAPSRFFCRACSAFVNPAPVEADAGAAVVT